MATSTVWPPPPFDIAFARFQELDAWYSGDTATLHDIYTGTGATHMVNGRRHRGGVIGTLSKWWWGQPVAEGEQRMKMHLPLAADLCTLSADLLFGEAPQVLFARPDNVQPEADGTNEWRHPAQDRLDAIIATDEAKAELLLGGEYAAALGGTYIATAWDPDVADHVFPKVFAADCAIPAFRHGRLASVQLWTEYVDGSEVYRLVEEHQPGSISYTLYRGQIRDLGQAVPLTARPETAFYEGLRNTSDVEAATLANTALEPSVVVGTGSQRLDVVYMPNARPVRDWRKLGVLANLGRSDLDGIQDLLDKVDQVWSSLMRDIDNGQGRLVVSEDLVETNGPGKGGTVDLYRQVFTPVGAVPAPAKDAGLPMTIVQFAIRVEEHLQTIEALKKEIASALGYSEAHLGIDNQTVGQRTATDVNADLSDSERTRDRKALFAKAALARWSLSALEIDKTVFGGEDLGDLSEPPNVIFAPVSQADPEKLARTALALDTARAASRREIVRTVHPDWNPDQVDAEADAIEKELAATPKMQDPTFPPFGSGEVDGGDDGAE